MNGCAPKANWADNIKYHVYPITAKLWNNYCNKRFIKPTTMYKLILFLALCFSFSSKAQQSWKQVWTAPIDSTAVWDVDQAGNAYLVDKQTICVSGLIDIPNGS